MNTTPQTNPSFSEELRTICAHHSTAADGYEDSFKLLSEDQFMAIEALHDRLVEEGQTETFADGWEAAIRDAVGHMQRSDLDHGLAYDWLCAQLTTKEDKTNEHR